MSRPFKPRKPDRRPRPDDGGSRPFPAVKDRRLVDVMGTPVPVLACCGPVPPAGLTMAHAAQGALSYLNAERIPARLRRQNVPELSVVAAVVFCATDRRFLVHVVATDDVCGEVACESLRFMLAGVFRGTPINVLTCSFEGLDGPWLAGQSDPARAERRLQDAVLERMREERDRAAHRAPRR